MFWIFGVGGPGIFSSVFPRGKGIRGVGLPPGVNNGVFFLDLGEFIGGGNFRVFGVGVSIYFDILEEVPVSNEYVVLIVVQIFVIEDLV